MYTPTPPPSSFPPPPSPSSFPPPPPFPKILVDQSLGILFLSPSTPKLITDYPLPPSPYPLPLPLPLSSPLTLSPYPLPLPPPLTPSPCPLHLPPPLTPSTHPCSPYPLPVSICESLHNSSLLFSRSHF